MKIQPTIYLHVGTAKTGTTALQNFITGNLARFAEAGYYYPETGRVHNCHHGIAFYWGDHIAFKKQFDIPDDQIARLSDELCAHRDKHILISSECLLLDTVNWEDFLSALPHKNIKIIIYLRRQDTFWASRYMELVKVGNITSPPAKWIERNFNPNEFIGILNNFSKRFGKENVIVRAYESKQFAGKSIFSDFCDILSMPLKNDFVISKKNFNPSHSLNVITFKRLVNTVFDAKSTPYIFNDLLTRFSLRENQENNVPFMSKNLFSPGKCREILMACEKVNAKVAREFFGRKDGRLFYDELPEPDAPWEPYPGLSSEKVKEIILFLFKEQPKLTVRLYRALTEAEPDNSDLQEAKKILIPPLTKVIDDKGGD